MTLRDTMPKSLGLLTILLTLPRLTWAGTWAGSTVADTYTANDVASHTADSDCWIIITQSAQSLVLDMSSFAHPGPANIWTCGQDDTTKFVNKHQNSLENRMNNPTVGANDRIVYKGDVVPVVGGASPTTPTPVAQPPTAASGAPPTTDHHHDAIETIWPVTLAVIGLGTVAFQVVGEKMVAAKKSEF